MMVRARWFVALTAIALTLTCVGALPAQAASPATFLGIAVGMSTTDDDNGLTVLEGIHNALWADELPVSEDLLVYTRWTGEGAHTVDVSIFAPGTGDIVAEAYDELDLSQDPVTYFTHDFTGTSFPESGAYTVEVMLDDEVVSDTRFYVNVDDELPEDPELVICVPAEDGFVDDAGDATISGIFEYFQFPEFPATDTFSVVTAWFSGDGSYDYTVKILDPKGRTIASTRTRTLDAYYGEMSVMTDTFRSVAFPAPGTYAAAVFLDGARVATCPLLIGSE